MKEYEHLGLERKWQKIWEEKKVFQAKDLSKQPKYYSLIEFPYPSGDGLHVGHPRPYIGMDVISRKKRMEGFNVLYPIGWDAFGLPTENYAIKTGQDPRVVTKKNSDTFRQQIKSLGISFDWSREINTTDPKYYKWTQWIFLQFLKKGLAYKAKIPINWCPSCKIGLANEEVVGGACERCGTPVEKKEKEQWMLGITKYAERLDKDLDTVDYLPHIKLAQRNWIGKSEGAEIEFKIKNLTPDLPPAPSQGRGALPGYVTTDAEVYKELFEKALEMRKNPTQAERKLWEALKANKQRYHFRRQHIIDHFIVDFLCLPKNLVIEIEGGVHNYQRERDAERINRLETLGYTILRFSNEEVLENLADVIRRINKKLETLPDYPLSLGEGQGEVELGIKVFTTRPDTIFGATYLAIAPEVAKKLAGSDFGVKSEENKPARHGLKPQAMAGGEKIGKDTGLRAINPANGEEIPVWVVNYVSYDYGTSAIMAVPAHDERDFEFAKKYSLPIKNVIEPTFFDNPREDLPFVEREAVHAILKHCSEDKYLVLKWKKVDWVTFITGGVDEGETPLQAVEREIREETGYQNFKLLKELPRSHSKFYHVPKKENRFAHFSNFYFELKNGEQKELTPDEKEKHELIWVTKPELERIMNIEGSLRDWHILQGQEQVYTGEGILANSGKFDGMDSEKVKREIVRFVGGREKTTFKLRDWVFSRQRYWGEPIPVVFCVSKGSPCSNTWVPVPEKDLPVLLPKIKNYQPTETGESPLANISKWVNTKCPKCKGPARRETDTMPNWAGSSWYYLRYANPQNSKEFASKKNLKYWLGPTPNPFPRKGNKNSLSLGEGQGGVDWYNGGNEHTTLHLLYSRFWHKFLYDLKLVPTSEPYKKRTSHGLILAEGGEKMSKSRGNVINPDDIVKRYGADTLRLYEMFMGPFDQAIAWSEEAIVGPRRFLERVWKIGQKILHLPLTPSKRGGITLSFGEGQGGVDLTLKKILHKTIKKVTEDIENMRFNTAISAMMILATEMERAQWISIKDFKMFLQILSPFAPHIAEELWQGLGEKKSISLSIWPKWDRNLIKDEEIKIAVQVNGKVRAEIVISAEAPAEKVKIQALANETAIKHIAGKNIKKVIYVPGRLINIVL